MVLSYGKYIELLSALDEHCKGTLEKEALQDAIFKHYTGLYRTFVAQNSIGTKKLFSSYMQSKTKTRNERKVFRKFMNTGTNSN